VYEKLSMTWKIDSQDKRTSLRFFFVLMGRVSRLLLLKTHTMNLNNDYIYIIT
jgi:hypothetical protein